MGTKEKIKRILIVTHSRPGFTDNMAKAIADGAKDPAAFGDVETVIKRVTELKPDNLAEADALAIGSPIYLSYISGELKHLLDNAFYKFTKVEKTNRLKGKPAAAFVSGRYKGYSYGKLQWRSTQLEQLETIFFRNFKMKKVVSGIHLVHDIESRDPRAPLPLTQGQTLLCRNIGRKLAEEISAFSPM
jgi:multimeric flavodoxin WrbA